MGVGSEGKISTNRTTKQVETVFVEAISCHNSIQSKSSETAARIQQIPYHSSPNSSHFEWIDLDVSPGVHQGISTVTQESSALGMGKTKSGT
mmetsp:Transcript_11983/g.34342  ORF Transcript_11983/g.34342 Transcript_11983/m.34342 type:complete len:92 (-) Transcript_11983:94-369(-)